MAWGLEHVRGSSAGKPKDERHLWICLFASPLMKAMLALSSAAWTPNSSTVISFRRSSAPEPAADHYLMTVCCCLNAGMLSPFPTEPEHHSPTQACKTLDPLGGPEVHKPVKFHGAVNCA
jgi:hypothetical protein